MTRTVKHVLLIYGLFTVLLVTPSLQATHLESTTGLDFQPELPPPSGTGFGTGFGSRSGGVNFSCNRPGSTNINCANGSAIDPDKTPFLQEQITEGGISYYHVIIGLPTDSFVQEVFIRAGGSGCFGFACSASRGGSGGGTGRFNSGSSGNGWDPLGTPSSNSGNGTGDPTRSIIKQVIDTAEMKQTFLKDKFANKPQITQDVITPDGTFHFELDMRNSTYASSTPGTMAITALFANPTIAADANFNSATDIQVANVTGGLFTYTQPTSTWFGGSTGGTFSYAGERGLRPRYH